MLKTNPKRQLRASDEDLTQNDVVLGWYFIFYF